MGLKEGAWVGLMLGNVPDFVILALALSKLDAAIVPIDPTTGGRELELILAGDSARSGRERVVRCSRSVDRRGRAGWRGPLPVANLVSSRESELPTRYRPRRARA